MMKKPVILSLFDHSGHWPMYFYTHGGYEVVLHDKKDGWDILENFPHNRCEGMDIVGLLAAVPCTDFAASGAQWWPEKEYKKVCSCCENTVEHSVLLAMAVLHLVDIFKPRFWCVENPIGRLHKLVPEMGKPKMYFDPCDYGDPYTKRTALYGNFNTNLKRTPVEPTEGSLMHKVSGWDKEKRQELRSITPLGFAWAFYQANKDITVPVAGQYQLFEA